MLILQNITKILLDFDLGVDAYRSVREAFPESQPHKVGNNIAKLKHPNPIPESLFRFVRVKGLVKRDERIIFLTKSGEWFDLKLNCRKHKSTCHMDEGLFAPEIKTKQSDISDKEEVIPIKRERRSSGEEEEKEEEEDEENEEKGEKEKEERRDEGGILVLIRFSSEINGFGWAVVEGVLSSKLGFENTGENRDFETYDQTMFSAFQIMTQYELYTCC